MENYLFKKEFNGRYLLREVPIIEGNKYRAYYVDYPSIYNDKNLNWSFFSFVINEDGISENGREDWNPSREEQEEIKNYIRTVLKPDDLREYILTKFYDYSYLVKHPSFANDECPIVYYPHFETVKGCNPGVRANWVFEIQKAPEDENAEPEYYEWIPTTYEKKYIMEFVRKEKPEDFVEFLFEPWCEGGYAVLKENIKIDPNTDGTVTYVVEYPIKGNSEWKFFATTEDEDGYAETEIWMLEDNKKEYIKEYVRNVLKPSDLYESEEKEMDNNLKDRLVFAIPKEKHEDVKRIVEAFINNEDEYMVDDMLVGEYLDVVKQRDDYESRMKQASEKLVQLQEQINNMPGDQNPLDVAEIERLKEQLEEQKTIVNSTTSKAIDLVSNILQFVQDNCIDGEEKIKELVDEDIEKALHKFGLDEWIPEKEKKYNIVEVEVEMKKTKTIKVVVPTENYSESWVDDYVATNCNGLEDIFDNEVAEFEFGSHDSYDSGLTKEQVCNDYSLDDIFPGTSDIEDEVF